MTTLFIKNGYILTLDEENTIFTKGDLLIQGDVITGIGEDGQVEIENIDRVIDAEDKIVMPGLVNAHIHSSERLMRGMADSLPNEIWNLYTYPATGASLDVGRRLYYLQTMIGLIESIKGGVTSIQDLTRGWLTSSHKWTDQAYFSAFDQIGIRASIGIGFVDKPWQETMPDLVESLPADVMADLTGKKLETHWTLGTVDDAERICETYFPRWHGYDNRITVMIAPSAPQRCTEAMLVKLGELAKQYDVPFHTHLVETCMQLELSRRAPFNGSMTRYLFDRNLLGPKTCVAHAIWLNDEDTQLLADTGTIVVHLPVCNQFMGSGVMPFSRFVQKGIPLALGTDGVAGNGNMSMFATMKMAALIHNTTTLDFNHWPSPLQVLRMATQGGALSMGLEDQLGMLKPGMKADIILLDRNTVSFTPLINVLNQLVYAENGSSVDTVIVGGRVVMENRKLKNVDEEEIIRELQTYLPGLEKFRQDAIISSKRIFPTLDAIYHQAASRTEDL